MTIETYVYKVGLINVSHRELDWFDDYEDAEAAAIQNSIDDDFWGIWDNKDELEAIAYGGRVYSL